VLHLFELVVALLQVFLSLMRLSHPVLFALLECLVRIAVFCLDRRAVVESALEVANGGFLRRQFLLYACLLLLFFPGFRRHSPTYCQHTCSPSKSSAQPAHYPLESLRVAAAT
jgi:hypothetical protein